MSTDTNERPVWDSEEIAYWRADCDYFIAEEGGTLEVRAVAILSLLDELERVRQERDAIADRCDVLSAVVGLARVRLYAGDPRGALERLDKIAMPG